MELVLADVHKHYGGVRALDGAELSARSGEVHGLLGPNGSGKSTMNKVLAGSVRPDRARISIDGEQVRIGSPAEAHNLGIAAAYQQLSVIEDLTVEDNLVLGTEPSRLGFIARKARRTKASDMLKRLRAGLPGVTLGTYIRDLSPGEAQLVEIGKVLLREPRILILDEATASLHRDQVKVLFDLIAQEKAKGTCILFVSHRLDEIVDICDRATILRAGQTVADVDIEEVGAAQLVQLMVGTELAVQQKEESHIRPEVALATRGLTAEPLEDVSFDLHAGEVLGLGGLQGQGQAELLLTLFGARPRNGGEIALHGKTIGHLNTAKAARNGIALVPGDRGREGTLPQRPIQENLSIASLGRRAVAGIALRLSAERDAGREMVEALSIKIGSLSDPISSLSGGNAQKVVVGKWLLNEPDIILLDDPTKGVDVGAKAEIYTIIRNLAARGCAVLLNSSEDRELVTLCDRVLVFYEGRIVSELSGQITEERLVSEALLVGGELDVERG